MTRSVIIRVSDQEHALLLRAKQELTRKGYDALPREVRPSPDEKIDLGMVVGIGSKLLVRRLEKEG